MPAKSTVTEPMTLREILRILITGIGCLILGFSLQPVFGRIAAIFLVKFLQSILESFAENMLLVAVGSVLILCLPVTVYAQSYLRKVVKLRTKLPRIRQRYKELAERDAQQHVDEKKKKLQEAIDRLNVKEENVREQLDELIAKERQFREDAQISEQRFSEQQEAFFQQITRRETLLDRKEALLRDTIKTLSLVRRYAEQHPAEAAISTADTATLTALLKTVFQLDADDMISRAFSTKAAAERSTAESTVSCQESLVNEAASEVQLDPVEAIPSDSQTADDTPSGEDEPDDFPDDFEISSQEFDEDDFEFLDAEDLDGDEPAPQR